MYRINEIKGMLPVRQVELLHLSQALRAAKTKREKRELVERISVHTAETLMLERELLELVIDRVCSRWCEFVPVVVGEV